MSAYAVKIAGRERTTRPFPARFASYIAASASAISVSVPVLSSSRTVRPIDTLTLTKLAHEVERGCELALPNPLEAPQKTAFGQPPLARVSSLPRSA